MKLEINDPPEFEEVNLDKEILDAFFEESDEQLASTEQELLQLSDLIHLGNKDQEFSECIRTALRKIHTLKGNAGFLNFGGAEKISHEIENILTKVSEEDGILEKEHVSLMLKAVDILKQCTDHLSGGNLEIPPSMTEKVHSELLLVKLAVPEKPTIDLDIDFDFSEEDSPAILTQDRALPGAAPGKQRRQDIRIYTDKLDQLINLIGELVISESMVSHNPELEDLELPEFEKAALQLKKNIRELQEVAMSMRMVPVSGVFKKMRRVVHDVSTKLGKPVHLEIRGEDTEVDKTVAEQITDPLLHLVRNALDHGIEAPEERLAAGKPEEGNILLEAKHVGNEVWIVIQDDGKGLSRERILEKACNKGLVKEGATLSDEEVWKLIFEAGFSTAEQVTDLSGRGVGMDVVKRDVEKLRGHVDVSSSAGKGCSLSLRIPLTLAVIDGMLVRVGKVRYVLPVASIRESFQPLAKDISHLPGCRELIQLRESVVPVIRLHDLHNIEPDTQELSKGILVLIGDHTQEACLFLDELLGEQQVVIKALPTSLGKLPDLSGCTIMSDGSVSLILDVIGLLAGSHAPLASH